MSTAEHQRETYFNSKMPNNYYQIGKKSTGKLATPQEGTYQTQSHQIDPSLSQQTEQRERTNKEEMNEKVLKQKSNAPTPAGRMSHHGLVHSQSMPAYMEHPNHPMQG